MQMSMAMLPPALSPTTATRFGSMPSFWALPRLSRSDARRIAGKTFVITGASSGFGRGNAVRLGSGGANVVLAARRTALLEEVASEVRAAGGQALVVTTDVTKPEEIHRLAEAAVKRFGRIDVWMNNAGVGVITRFWDGPEADYSRLIDINLKGVVYGSLAAIRQFRAQGYGALNRWRKDAGWMTGCELG
jgi:NADP-dependent 3-hydroxy acid dehydrogenase YdfG